MKEKDQALLKWSPHSHKIILHLKDLLSWHKLPQALPKLPMLMTLHALKNKLFSNNINLPTMGLLLKAPPTDKLFINLINLPKMGLLPKVNLVEIKSKSMILKDPLEVMTPLKWKLMK